MRKISKEAVLASITFGIAVGLAFVMKQTHCADKNMQCFINRRRSEICETPTTCKN